MVIGSHGDNLHQLNHWMFCQRSLQLVLQIGVPRCSAFNQNS